MEEYPDCYPNTNAFRSSTYIIGNQGGNSSKSSSRSGSKAPSKLDSMIDSVQGLPSEVPEQEPKVSVRKQRFAIALKKQKEIKKRKKYKVLVCTVQGDCIMRPLRPVFLLSEADWMDSPE
jgi:hypothetical protein